MSHPIINVVRYHSGSDDWRTPYRLFRNLHREFGFSMDGAATEHDALLPRFTDDIHNQSWVGERVFCNPPFSMAERFLLKAPEADVCVYVWFRTGQRQLTGFGVYIQTPSCMRFERYTEQSNTFHQQGRKAL
ncbi:TPA: DNA N-6-adenine-methyltransferase [Escherichia coli]